MRVLITGGSGYIGNRVMRDLAARDDVEAIVNVDVQPPTFAVPKATFVERSVEDDLRDLTSGPAKFDVALHLAWTVDPLRDARKQTAICIGGTRNFLAACEAGAIGQVLFVSSGTAYGADPRRAPNHRIGESEPLLPGYHFQYSREKREAEQLCERFAQRHPEVLLQVVRPVIVAGPNVDNFIFRAMERSPTMRPLGRDPIVQFVHEDDCAAAIVAVVASKRPGAFNISADGSVPLGAVYRRFNVRALPAPVPVMHAIAAVAWKTGASFVADSPAEFVYFVAYPWYLSNQRLKDELGFRFRYDAARTFDATIEAWETRRRAKAAAQSKKKSGISRAPGVTA